jgi:nucleoside-diphosphate-sugar epimerase
MRALVTGGAGFIGSHLVDHLLERGEDVSVLLRPGEQPSELPQGRVRLFEGDVRDAKVVCAAAESADVIFHLAARTDLRGSTLEHYSVNTRGTEVVLAAAREARCRRVIFFSSMLAVALTGRKDPIDERWTEEAASWYGRSKRVGEELVRASGIPFSILRPTLAYGPRERSTMHGFLKAIYRRRFMLIGNDVLQTFAYVKNVARAAYDASRAEAAAGATFFVSDARPCTLAEFAGAAASALGVRPLKMRLPVPLALAGAYLCDAIGGLIGRELPLSVRRVRTMTTHYVYSIEAARRAFGYSPPYMLEPALAETARWYLERGLL